MPFLRFRYWLTLLAASKEQIWTGVGLPNSCSSCHSGRFGALFLSAMEGEPEESAETHMPSEFDQTGADSLLLACNIAHKPLLQRCNCLAMRKQTSTNSGDVTTARANLA